MSTDRLLRMACDWVLEAGEKIRQEMGKTLEIAEKGAANDLVTNLDIATEQFLRAKISSFCQESRIFGEEGQSQAQASEFSDLKGRVWFIDPIDGTLNFVKQRRDFGIMLSLYDEGKPVFGIVYDVMRDELLVGVCGEGAYLNGRRLPMAEKTSLKDSIILIETGQIRRKDPLTLAACDKALAARIVGSSAMVSSVLARQAASCFIARKQMPWDSATPYAILTALGYRITLLDGTPPTFLAPESMIMAASGVYEELMAMLDKQS